MNDANLLLRLACGSGPRLSNATWGSRFTSPTERGATTGNPFDWDAARAAYLDALTLAQPRDREATLARTLETLGHVMHLVQDLAVPAHARNDFLSHLQYCFQFFTRWCENDFERFVRINAALVDDARGVSLEFASARVTRFWDLDLYTGANPSNEITRGLAEYTNANFASQYTILTESFDPNDPKFFPYPRESSTNLRDLVTQTLAARAFIAEDQKVDLGLYIRKTGDGESIEHFARLGYLWSDIPPDQLRLSLQLDEVVNADYAALLLPRAIAYSRGLLDYFFRGKLDVDLDVDVTESGQTQFLLNGANGTKDDALGPGTLALYRDAASGERSSAISAPVSGTVQPGKDLFPAAPPPAFPAAADDGERPLMAVYTGTLGFEQPMGTSPGGVIGRLIPGIRAETIFPDGTIRNLRAVEGVFSLPPAVDGLDTIQWGDLDNSFVGLASATPGTLAPDQVKVFTLNRAVGSPTVPLLEVTQVVDASLLKAINFPFGLGLPTTLDYALAHFGQGGLTIVDIKETIVFKSVIVDGVEAGGYEAQPLVVTISSEGGGGGLIEFAQRVPIVLDREHLLAFDTDPRPYGWRVVEVSLDAQQRPLALVEVQLTLPPGPVNQDFLAPAFDENGNRFVAPVVPVQGRFPIDILLWALIDVERGTVLGVTSEPTVSIRRVELHNTERRFFHTTIEFLGGENPPPKFEQWTERADLTPFLDPRLLNNDFPTELLGATITVPSQGVQTLSLDGWYRADLHPLVGPQIQTSATPFGESALTVAVDPVARKNLQVRLTGITVFSTNNYFALIRQGMRMRPTPAGATPEVLLLFGIPTGVIIGEGEEAKLVAWSPQVAENTRLAFPDELPRSNYTLLGATPRAALVRAQDTLGRFTTFLFDLRKATSTLLASQDLGEQYVLLAPKFLYNIMDTKFHAPRADLSPTFLPRSLAPGPAIPAPQAAYHLIRVR